MLDNVAKAHWLSPTQIDMYRLCQRKWGWRYLNRIKPPPNSYAERGIALHDIQANWLHNGVAPDQSTEYGKICAPGISCLPEPGAGLVEHKFRFMTDIACYMGVWDLFVPVAENFFPVGPPEVYDHKFTSDFKWLKSAADLSKDVQASLYAVGAIVTTKEETEKYGDLGVALNWVYCRTQAKRAAARPVQLHVIPDEHEAPKVNDYFLPGNFGVLRFSELKDNFDKIEITAEQMLDHHRKGHKALDLNFNVEGCNAFGGCPYNGSPLCDLSMGQIVGGHMAQDSKSQSLAEKMKGGGAASSQPTETAAEKPAGGNGKSLAERMAGSGGESSEAAAPSTATSQPETVAGKMGAAEGPKVNPPEENAGEETSEAAEGVREAQKQEGELDIKRFGATNDADLADVALAMRKEVDLLGEDFVTIRLDLAGKAAQGLIESRLWNHADPTFIGQVSSFSLEIADDILRRSVK